MKYQMNYWMKLFSAISAEVETLISLLSNKRRIFHVVGFGNTVFV